MTPPLKSAPPKQWFTPCPEPGNCQAIKIGLRCQKKVVHQPWGVVSHDCSGQAVKVATAPTPSGRALALAQAKAREVEFGGIALPFSDVVIISGLLALGFGLAAALQMGGILIAASVVAVLIVPARAAHAEKKLKEAGVQVREGVSAKEFATVCESIAHSLEGSPEALKQELWASVYSLRDDAVALEVLQQECRKVALERERLYTAIQGRESEEEESAEVTLPSAFIQVRQSLRLEAEALKAVRRELK